MKDKDLSISTAEALLPQLQEVSAEITQVVTELQVAKDAICNVYRIEDFQTQAVDRTRAARTLRAIAHRLAAGTLGLLVGVSAGVGWQSSNEPDVIGQSKSIEVL